MATVAMNSPISQRKRFLGRSIPTEGENGVFSQSWFPLCLSSEVPSANGSYAIRPRSRGTPLQTAPRHHLDPWPGRTPDQRGTG